MNVYHRNQVCGFRKVKEEWGLFSNMSPHPIIVNGIRIPTTEALYQAMKYPQYPEIQQKILEQKSPMAAKMVQKGDGFAVHPEWDFMKIDVMEWCLKLKVAFHSVKFRREHEAVRGRDIVEISHKDRFWGAVPDKSNPDILEGSNVLGQLWMVVLDEIDWDDDHFLLIDPPDIPELRLYNDVISSVDRRSIRNVSETG